MAAKKEKILTLHPEGKKGVNIDRAKYDQMKAAIVQVLEENDTIGFTEMMKTINSRLKGKFEGAISWYFVSVKLDMEARGELIRLPGKGRQIVKKGQI